MAKFLCLKDALKVVARDRCRHGKLNTSPFNTKQRDAFFLQGDCILNAVKPLFITRFQGVSISSSTPLCRQLVSLTQRHICGLDWAFSKLFNLHLMSSSLNTFWKKCINQIKLSVVIPVPGS